MRADVMRELGSDRHAKRVRAGLEVPNVTADAGDFDEPDHLADAVGVT
jgi:hypothetical protein